MVEAIIPGLLPANTEISNIERVADDHKVLSVRILFIYEANSIPCVFYRVLYAISFTPFFKEIYQEEIHIWF